jgi:hypothetical protein
MQRGVIISDISSYGHLKSELAKKERDLERISTEVETLKKKKAAVLGKMSDNATDIIVNAYLTVQASEANRLKRKFQTDTFGSQDSGRSLSGDDDVETAIESTTDIADTKAGGATSSGWFGMGGKK